MAAIDLCAINAGLPGMITEPTYAMVTDILEPAIEEFAEEHGIPFEFNAREHTYRFPWWGSSIMCRSGDKPRRLRGPNLAWAGIDEVCDQEEEVLTTLQGRVRHPKARLKRIMACGTPRGFNWVYERFAEVGGARRLPDASILYAKASDNTFVTDSDPEWVASMASSYDPELYRQEVLGEFVAIGQHSTYYAFSREGNLRRGLDHDENLPVIVCCDFNRAPLAWVFAQTKGRRFETRVIGELTDEGLSTDDACDEVIRRFGSPAWIGNPRGTTYHVYGDATAFTPTTSGNYSDFETIRDRLKTSPRVLRRNPRTRDRTNSVNALLTSAAGEHRLLIDEAKCPRLVRDLLQTKNIPGSFDIDGSNEDLTHYSNALSFYAVQEHPIQATSDLMKPRAVA